MLNLIRQLYKDFESIYKINRITNLSIFPSITFMTALISNPYTILNNLAAKTLFITHLYFNKDQCMIFVLLVPSVRQII